MMSIDSILQLLSQANQTRTLYFVQKTKENYITFSPEVSDSVLDILVAMAIEFLSKYQRLEIVDFSPIGYRENTIEQCDVSYVGNYNEVDNCLQNSTIEDLDINPEEFTFYCLELSYPNSTCIKLFRRVKKFHHLYSKGFFAAFNGNELNKVDGKLLGIDGDVDLISDGRSILITSHISLERVFRLEEQYHEKAKEALLTLRSTGKIVNINRFIEDCLGDLNIRKILTKMLSEGENLVNSFSRIDNIKKTIEIFELDIKIQDGESISVIYEDKSQIKDILRFARDSYYQSMIRNTYGIDDKI